MKTVYVFGNLDLPSDSLPLRILPELKAKFPSIRFEVKDPNEDWAVPVKLIVIDTVINLKKITIFESLEKFTAAPRISMHDFDALANLRLLKKIGRLKEIKIIGLPPAIAVETAVRLTGDIISKLT
ncbi:MAG: hypothetical protein AAB677_00660 [Patescibacteria group bacterium]